FGALAVNCMQNVPQGQVVWSHGDIVLHDGSSYRSIIDGKNRDYLFDDMDTALASYSYTAKNEMLTEIWFCYCSNDNSSGFADKALCWNWRSDTWREQTLGGFSYIAGGQVPEASASEIIDNVSTIIDDYPVVFDATASSHDKQRLVGVKAEASSPAYIFDESYTFDGTDYETKLERQGLTIVGRDRQGAWKVDQESVKFLRNIYPKVEAADGTILNFYIGIQLEQTDAITWDGPYPFTVGTTVKIDCTLTTRLLSLRVLSSTNYFKLLGYDLDMDVVSRY
ncbi:hypothetical protein KA005_66200, partial [bacterium]|nr:hypothetical protein [bacterium]